MPREPIEPFTKFRDVPPDRIDEAIAALTAEEWELLERGYIIGAAIEISDWWDPMLGLHRDVDSAALFCKLYQLSLARGPEDRP